MLRQIPALCAGVMMLAACTNGSGSETTIPQTVVQPVPNDPPFEDMNNYFVDQISTVHFDVDSSTLTEPTVHLLQRQAAWLMAEGPRRTITIEGHADERGTREYNLALGEHRAQAIMDYLTAVGIDPKRMKTISYGKERPVCVEASEACWTQNRRGVSTLDE
jgi:peptidoglycan-associated lipoprotein